MGFFLKYMIRIHRKREEIWELAPLCLKFMKNGIFVGKSPTERKNERNKYLRNRVDTRYGGYSEFFTKDIVFFCGKLEKRSVFSKIYSCILSFFGLE